MNNITISTPVYSSIAAITLRDNGKHNLGDTTRRVSRTATLDGGNVFVDGGSTVSDRTINIDLSEATVIEYATLRAISTTYREVTVSTAEGCFLCSVVSLNNSKLTLYIKEEV